MEADGGIFQLAAQPLPGIIENLVVIEGERWVFVCRKPLGIGGVAASAQMKLVCPQQRVIDHGDDPRAWVAPGSPNV